MDCFAFCHALNICLVGELWLYAVKLWCLHLQIYSRGNHASSVGHQAAFDCQVWPLLFIKLKNLSQKLSPPFYKPHRAGRTEWSLATFILLNSGCSCLSTMATFTFGTTRASSSSSRLRWETIFGLHFPTCRCAIVIFSFPGLRSSSQSGGFCTKEKLGRHWFWWHAGWCLISVM